MSDTKVPLNFALSLPDNKGINNAYIDIILKEEIPVLCINKAAKKQRNMPFKVLYENNKTFWQQDTKWEYYFTGEFFNSIEEKAVESGTWDKDKIKSAFSTSSEDVEVGYGSEYKAIAEMTTEEKIQCLNKNKQRLLELTTPKTRDKKVFTEILVDSTKDAALINHAALEEALRLGDDEAKKLTQDLVDSTFEMVKSSVHIISEQDVLHDELMSTLVEKSNGTIVQHMTRVYLTGISFLSYYHRLVSTSSTIQKLRISFAEKYSKYYQTLLPHYSAEHINLERVFFGGMRAIASELYYKWAIGFLIHDIGKASAVEYHEGESKYDRSIVIDHVKQGYKNILAKTNYPKEAALITGYHHEYYGDPGGYGYFRAYLQQYKKQNPNSKQDYIMSFDMEPIVDYRALAYFPAKVLEIIDVYDSVTDPHRIYRQALTPEEALIMMREEFIEKNLKIDPIIFDIFSSYIAEKQKKKAA